jgi:hypothetical protein
MESFPLGFTSSSFTVALAAAEDDSVFRVAGKDGSA